MFFFIDFVFYVDWFIQYVYDMVQSCFIYWDFNWVFEVFYIQIVMQIVGGIYCDGMYDIAVELLLNFQYQMFIIILYFKSIVYVWYGILREFDVNYGVDYLDNFFSSYFKFFMK